MFSEQFTDKCLEHLNPPGPFESEVFKPEYSVLRFFSSNINTLLYTDRRSFAFSDWFVIKTRISFERVRYWIRTTSVQQ